MILTPIQSPLPLKKASHYFCVNLNWQDLDESFFTSKGIFLPQNMKEDVPKKKAHFLGGRYCAHQALSMMKNNSSEICSANEKEQAELIPIKKNEQGAPIWPEGVIGSITHTENFIGAVVESSDNLRGIGIDTEKILGPQSVVMVESLVATDEEKRKSLSFDPFEYFTLIYSAKESIFKCLNPIIQKYIEFHDVTIETVSFDSKVFTFRLLKDLNEEFKEGMSFEGSFHINQDQEKLHTAFELYH